MYVMVFLIVSRVVMRDANPQAVYLNLPTCFP